MTREELEHAQGMIRRANELLGLIDKCDELEPQRASISLRFGGDSVGSEFSQLVIAAGLKAVREQAEAELASLQVMPLPFGVARDLVPPPHETASPPCDMWGNAEA